MSPPESGAELAEWREGRLSTLLERTEQVDPVQLGSQFCYIDVSAVSRKTLSVEEYSILNANEAPSRARKFVRKGDVIFATIRPYLKQIAKIPEHLDGQICSTAFCVLRANPSFADPDFIFQAVSSDAFVQRVCEYQTGSNYPAVSDTVVTDQKIVIPPIPEQHRIAVVLATVDEAISSTNSLIEAIEAVEVVIAESLFSSLHESKSINHDTGDAGPGDIWPTVTLAEILSEKLTAGYSGLETQDEDGVNCLTLSAVTNNDISLRHTKKIVADRARVSDIWIRKDDIFIERSNNYDLVGLSSIYEGDEPFAIFPDLLIRVRVDTEMARPKFVARYLRSKSIRSYFARYAKGTSGSMKKIDQRIVSDVRIPLPPLAEQRRIVDIFSTLDDRLALERAERDRLVVLKKGLMQVLLTGKVRVPPGVAEEVAPAHA